MAQYDADMLRKVDLINKKIDEINARKANLHTTAIEEELDRQELDDYIKSLKLSPEQQAIVDRHNRNGDPAGLGGDWLPFVIVALGIFVQFYVCLEIYRLIIKGTLETLELAYLALLIGFFSFNTFQMLRYLRVVR